ncbi:MAG: hypothetical protein JKY88_15270 [Pseudomonadales bacterium]|nr:hypothetical protein [Pseudomonadales bacterium]
MNKRIKSLISICMITLLAACGDSGNQVKSAERGQAPQENTAPKSSVAEIIAEAEKVYAAAKEREHAWTITRKHIKKAREALSAGHTEAALESAERALSTAQASLIQAKRESVAWKERVLKTSS